MLFAVHQEVTLCNVLASGLMFAAVAAFHSVIHGAMQRSR
jgi:hypothetical protein